MSTETEQFKLEDGSVVGTGLLMPTAQETKLMSVMAAYPERMLLDWSDIEKRLMINGQQRYLADRKKRRKRMRNQANLGKCNGSSNTSAVENLRSNQGMPDIPLSDCFAYACVNGGRDQGSGLINTLTSIQQIGISPMQIQVGGMTKTLPTDFYNFSQISSALVTQAKIEAKRFLGFEYFKAPIDSAESYIHALASAIARDQQVIFAWHVGNNSMRLNNGIVQVGRGPGNHSNLFHSAKWVGGKTKVLFDDQNSWGPSVNALYGPVQNYGWGEEGFGLFDPYDAFACANNHCTYICTSVRVDANDPAFQTAS